MGDGDVRQSRERVAQPLRLDDELADELERERTVEIDPSLGNAAPDGGSTMTTGPDSTPSR